MTGGDGHVRRGGRCKAHGLAGKAGAPFQRMWPTTRVGFTGSQSSGRLPMRWGSAYMQSLVESGRRVRGEVPTNQFRNSGDERVNLELWRRSNGCGASLRTWGRGRR